MHTVSMDILQYASTGHYAGINIPQCNEDSNEDSNGNITDNGTQRPGQLWLTLTSVTL